MPEEIVSRILRLPGYGIYGWETDEVANTLIRIAIRRSVRNGSSWASSSRRISSGVKTSLSTA